MSDCCKISPGSPLAYYYGRPVLHGAQLSPIELLLVPVVSNIYISTLSLVSNCCKMSPRSPLAYYHCRLVPHGAHLSLMELLLVPVVRNHYMSPFDGCPTAVKFLQGPLLLITMADLCSMGLICPLWSSCWFLWSVISIYRPFHWCQTAAKCLQGPLLLIIIADLCPMGLNRPLWSSCWFLWSEIIICRPLMGVRLL